MWLDNCSGNYIGLMSALYLYPFIGIYMLYSSWICMLHIYNSIAQKFPYLVKKKLKEGQEIRRVAQMDWNIIGDDGKQPFFPSGLKFIPLPVSNCKSLLLMWDFSIPSISWGLTTFLDVGYAWRGLCLFGLSFWRKKQGGLYIWCFTDSC